MRLLGAACQYRLVHVARIIKRKTINEVREIQWKAVDSIKEVLDKLPPKVRRSPTITFVLTLLDEWLAGERAARGYALPESLASWPRDIDSWWFDIKRLWGIQPDKPPPPPAQAPSRVQHPHPIKLSPSSSRSSTPILPTVRRTGALSEILHETSVEPTARQRASPLAKRPLPSPVERPASQKKRHRPTQSPDPPSESPSRMSFTSSSTSSSSHGGMSALFQAIDMTSAVEDGRRRGVPAI